MIYKYLTKKSIKNESGIKSEVDKNVETLNNKFLHNRSYAVTKIEINYLTRRV